MKEAKTNYLKGVAWLTLLASSTANALVWTNTLPVSLETKIITLATELVPIALFFASRKKYDGKWDIVTIQGLEEGGLTPKQIKDFLKKNKIKPAKKPLKIKF